MTKINRELLKRTLFALILIAIFVPTFVITKYGGQTGRIIAAIVFMIVGMYAIFEILVVLKIQRSYAFIATLVVPFFFALPVDNFISIIRLNKSVDNLSILAKRAITGWEGWIITFVFAFIPLILQFAKRVTINFTTQVIITFIFLLLPVFTKLFWVYNIKGLEIITFFILIAAITDMGGYFGGRFFGTKWFHGKKLAPRISPRKTYAGFVFGTTLAIIFAILYGYFAHIWSDFKNKELIVAILFGIALPFVAVLGDLFFSLIKRLMSIKDFSNIIPGHGGLMDRLDAMSFVFVLSGVFLLFVFN